MDMIAAVGELLYLGRADVESLLDVDAMLDALAEVLVIYSSGAASVPPRTALRLGDRGLLGLMPGHVPGVALEAKLVTVFPANDEHGLPSHQGLIALFDESRAKMRRSSRSSAPACRGGRTWRPFHASATSRRSASLRAMPTAPKIWPNAVCTHERSSLSKTRCAALMSSRAAQTRVNPSFGANG